MYILLTRTTLISQRSWKIHFHVHYVQTATKNNINLSKVLEHLFSCALCKDCCQEQHQSLKGLGTFICMCIMYRLLPRTTSMYQKVLEHSFPCAVYRLLPRTMSIYQKVQEHSFPCAVYRLLPRTTSIYQRALGHLSLCALCTDCCQEQHECTKSDINLYCQTVLDQAICSITWTNFWVNWHVPVFLKWPL